ncbi:MAG TPA: hypothetical protein P5548_04240 [Candidatus Moranbacteria bacterium]|nr:hypothetical protein [Candidatus Moranbacteria bacterium]HRZ34079.1 hypothetical protein [Candidatus Moranbacteria bacterium]
MFTRQVVTNKQLKPVNYRKSSVMTDMLKKGGKELLKTGRDRQAFWNSFRKEAKGGLTNEGLKKAFGRLMKNKEDRFSDKKMRDLSKIWNKGKSYTLSGSSSSQNINEKHSDLKNNVKNESGNFKSASRADVRSESKENRLAKDIRSNIPETKTLNLKTVNYDINKTESSKLFAGSERANMQEMEKDISLAKYFNKNQESYNINDVKDRLRKLQENTPKEENKPVSFQEKNSMMNSIKEMDQQEKNQASLRTYTANRQEDSYANIGDVKNRLKELQENHAMNESVPASFQEKNNIQNDAKEISQQEEEQSAIGVYIPGLHKKDERMDKIKERLAEVQKKADEKEIVKEDASKKYEQYTKESKNLSEPSLQKETISANIKKIYSDYSFKLLAKDVIAESGFDLYSVDEKGCLLFQDLAGKSESEIDDYIYNLVGNYSNEGQNFEKVKEEKIAVLSLLSEDLTTRTKDRNLSEDTQAKIKDSVAEIERIIGIIKKCNPKPADIKED